MMQAEPNVSHGIYTCAGGEGANIPAGKRRVCVVIEIDLALSPPLANIRLEGYASDGFPNGAPFADLQNVPMATAIDLPGTWVQVTA